MSAIGAEAAGWAAAGGSIAGMEREAPSLFEQAVERLRKTGNQALTIYPNGQATIVDRWSLHRFFTLAELEEWVCRSLPPIPPPADPIRSANTEA